MTEGSPLRIRQNLAKSAGRVLVVALIVMTLLISVLALEEANPDVADELFEVLAIGTPFGSVDALAILVWMAGAWAILPAVVAVTEYKRVIH